MDRGAQAAMRDSMGTDAGEAGASRVLRAGGEGEGRGCSAGADGGGERGVVETIRFTVPGQPVGKGRPRAFRMGKGVRMFTPEKTATYENLIATAAHGAMRGRPPVEGAVSVDLDIRLMVPMSWSAKRRGQALEGLIHPTKKPDADNVTKSIFDAMNGIVWGDDVQVVRLSLRKRYGATPGVTVAVRGVE